MDDIYTDPEILTTSYRLGGNPARSFFEVELAVAEQSTTSRNTSGSTGNQSVLTSSYNAPVIGCVIPTQTVWRVTDWTTPNRPILEAVAASSLIGAIDAYLYNPLTREACLVTNARLLTNQPLERFETQRGAVSVHSQTHKLIRTTLDTTGSLSKYFEEGEEVLVFDSDTTNIYIDEITLIEAVGTGDVVEISLASGFIYASGEGLGLVAHNRKQYEEIV